MSVECNFCPESAVDHQLQRKERAFTRIFTQYVLNRSDCSLHYNERFAMMFSKWSI